MGDGQRGGTIFQFGKDPLQKAFVKVNLVTQREVEVLGESVRLEEALLEIGSALEYPIFGEFLMGIDAGEHPTEDIVFLDDMRRERRLGSKVKDFALVN